jgi:predicted lipoprotein with Yx(FWY)xxD motif
MLFMKKIFLAFSLILALAGVSFAQAPATTKTAKKPTSAASAKPAATTVTKKDGTADMRYKANKDAAKTPPVHAKKDGTPDKRYKENKKS